MDKDQIIQELKKWLIPHAPHELVILSSREVIYGICMRIDKRSGIIAVYDDDNYPLSKMVYDYAPHAHKAFVRLKAIRIRSKTHKSKLASLDLPTSGGILLLNPHKWQGFAVSGIKFKYWRDYGSNWLEKMQEDHARNQRFRDFIRDL